MTGKTGKNSIIVTRPETTARSMIDRLKCKKLDVIHVPLHHNIPVDFTVKSNPFGIIFTSVNGVLYGSQAVVDKNRVQVFAVGAVTAQAAREAGFSSIITGEGTATSLLSKIKNEARISTQEALVHLGGKHLSVDLAQALNDEGFDAEHVVCYEAKKVESASDFLREQIALKGRYVLFFSKRAAESFEKLYMDDHMKDYTHQMVAVCLSERIAEGLTAKWQSVEIAAEKSEDSLLKTLEHLITRS
ncbi:uroporphyrinogen-III synthase [Temperatibacter marinus]|uniref:Uroporphyrinogen-III synthase n=1 Tax=Temperatibacter marinus TaxID=1456591 RepID=A0AA52EE30_9PROT|nr:uroporphyrinogen-III synthase [Temperatibacter marinus]WND03752.1 uroporphyrinogen-III synthase [Temperatibacter marinus]